MTRQNLEYVDKYKLFVDDTITINFSFDDFDTPDQDCILAYVLTYEIQVDQMEVDAVPDWIANFDSSVSSLSLQTIDEDFEGMHLITIRSFLNTVPEPLYAET